MPNIELKSIENYMIQQARIIENLKDIIQLKDDEITRLWHENRMLKEGLGGSN